MNQLDGMIHKSDPSLQEKRSDMLENWLIEVFDNGDLDKNGEIDLTELETAHRVNAKIIQGTPMNIPSPAPLATLGWLSIKSYIFLIRILLSIIIFFEI